ncbi:MAG TPA: ATP-binding protein [Gemmatimonadaceae bacterium]|nr:ATP-binding protein [Gemmatimonadaceae bacterium]
MTAAASEMDAEQLASDARRERLGELLAFIDGACARAGVPRDLALDVRLAAEEVVTNVIEHGYAGAGGPITIGVRREPRRVVIVVEDRAPPFDPATVPAVDPAVPLDHRQIGGLGWHLATRVMDEVRHELVHPRGNRLTLVKRLAAED